MVGDIMMGDILRSGDAEVRVRIDVPGASPIERFDFRNGLETVEVFRPYDEAALGRRIRIFRLPDEHPHYRVTLERRVQLADDRDNALYVRITHEDGHVVWPKPVSHFH